MSLTPADIEAQIFRAQLRGYDPDEVDEFLDRVSDRIAELTRERDEIAGRLERLQSEAAESIETEKLLKRTLVTAQRTADETVAQARQQASETTAEADRKAAETLDAAQRRAAEIVAEAERRATELLVDARTTADKDQRTAREELERVQRSVSQLQRFRSEYRERVRAVVAEQLSALDRVGDLPDLPEGLGELSADPEPTVSDLYGGGGG